jgi:hypothetical protein
MELPPLKRRIFNFKSSKKDQATSQSIDNLSKNKVQAEIYRLNGNMKAIKLQNYSKLMKDYMEYFSSKKAIKDVKKELSERKVSPTSNIKFLISKNNFKRYRLSKTPTKLNSF